MAAAAALAPAADAAEVSWDGYCWANGSVAYERPVTYQETANRYRFTGRADCHGRLNGIQVDQGGVVNEVSGPFVGSCWSARSQGPGQGLLRFKPLEPGGPQIVVPYEMTFEADVARGIVYALRGLKSGRGSGDGEAGESAGDFPAIFAQCFTTGWTEVVHRARSNTQAPLVADVPDPAPPAPSPPAPRPEPGLEVPSQTVSAVARNGLRVVCRAPGPAVCRLGARLRGRRAGTDVARIAAGRHEATARIRMTRRARRALRRGATVIEVVATVRGDHGTSRIGARARLRR